VTTFETLTEIESLQGPTALYGRLLNATFWDGDPPSCEAY
jgi:hypothetical protein